MARKHVVLVAEDPQELSDLVIAVQAKGFVVEEVIKEIGSVFGSADESELTKIELTPGILRIQEESMVQLPSADGNGPF